MDGGKAGGFGLFLAFFARKSLWVRSLEGADRGQGQGQEGRGQGLRQEQGQGQEQGGSEPRLALTFVANFEVELGSSWVESDEH